MTRSELITQVAERLGDTSTSFKDDVLSDFFDRVLEEMATNDCIRSLRKTTTATLTAGDSTYDTRTLTGMSAPDYPVDIIRLLIPALGTSGMLTRLEEDDFLHHRLSYIDSDGNLISGQPQVWCLYPNEQQLYISPAPSSDYVTSNSLEVHYIAPPTVIASGTEISEIRREHLTTVIYGMIAHGANFQDETLPDLRSARQMFEAAMYRMKVQNNKEPMRDKRVRYRDI